MKPWFIIYCSLLLGFLGCKVPYFGPSTLYVTAYSGLTLRASPDQKSTAIAVLPFGEAVPVIGMTEHESVIEGVRAKWIETSFQGKPAYAFSGFLAATQPAVVVAAAYSPSKRRQFVLHNLGPATLSQCQNKYSATCVLRVIANGEFIYERQGDAAVRWLSEDTILLREDFGDAGYNGSRLSILDVRSGVKSLLCAFGSYIPLAEERPAFKIEYSICGAENSCEGFRVNTQGTIERAAKLHESAQIIERFQATNPTAGFDGSRCYFASGNRRFTKP